MSNKPLISEIENIESLRRQLAQDIQLEVARLTQKFHRDAGITISSIYIPMIDVTSHGDRFKKHVVSNVVIGLDIWR